jgi:integrase/recombinase XerD
MDATAKSGTTVQARDLDRVKRLWHQLGHTPESIGVYSRYVKRILQSAQTSDYSQLSAKYVVHLARLYALKHHADPQSTQRQWLSAFRAFAWGLQRLGKTTGPTILTKLRPGQVDPTIAAFQSYGRSLGWAEATLHIHERYLCDLQHFLASRRAPWPEPRLQDLDLFLELRAKRWKLTTVAGAAGTFRAWLRFLFVTGRSERNLASSVVLPPSIWCPRPPRALPWKVVQKLRRGIDPTTAIGQRDTAQYLLFCAYGLSSAEVTNLKLDDIDWDGNILHIRRLKNSSTVDLPLSAEVAKSIARYLRHGRPPTSSRNVFVSHIIPFGPLSHSNVGQRVKCWAERAKVHAPYLGAHVFRFSFATHQLERGTPLKLIGDILGHRHSQTTAIYARSALERLRRLSLPVPK